MPKSAMRKPRTFSRRQRPADVVAELRKRGRAGRSLASGANRGDWLYAAALRWFKTWGAAVDAAGFAYGDHREAALTREDLVRRIQAAAKAGTPLRWTAVPALLVSNAKRHFGSWSRAVKAAGLKVPPRLVKWTRESVVARIQDRQRAGLNTNSVAGVREEQRLYGAGRNVFGTWAAALKAAGIKPLDPGRPAGRARRA